MDRDRGSRLGDLIDQALAEGPQDLKREDVAARARLLRRLFALYGEADPAKFETYLAETQAIPFDKLAFAVRLLLRSHLWPRMPVIAELWQAARAVAGMDRPQYEDGRYLPPPREWPPEGQRHTSVVGRFEPLHWLGALPGGVRPQLEDVK